MIKQKKLPYLQRIDYCINPTAKRLCEIISNKSSNLCLSADLTDTQALLTLAEEVGPEICLLKTHVDILENFSMQFITKLKDLAKKHTFLLFEDRKFADIGNTVKQQYQGGLFRIADWADITNAHTMPGPGIVKGLRSVGLSRQRGLLLLAQMSTEGSLTQDNYIQASLTMAHNNLDFVIGFIAQRELSKNPGLLHLTPGVKFTHSSGDGLGQQYISPDQAIIENRTDIIIVGRDIYQARDPHAEAVRYRESSWEAYNRCC